MRVTSYQHETTDESPTPSPSGSWQHLVSEPTIKDLSSTSAAPVPRISSTPRADALEDASISPESTSAGSGSPAPSLMSSMFGTSAPPSPTPAPSHKLDAVPEWVEVVSANAHSGDSEVVVSERAEAVKTPVVSDMAQEVEIVDTP
ncbi:hypothetical protein PENSPDRAFT_649838 [Peniophora sp. CONT]|nr:hypothetical protein PENSPDRAFT_649838 [Peniophora sp. CONT]